MACSTHEACWRQHIAFSWDSLLCGTKLQVSRHTSAVFALAIFTVGCVVSVRRIIGSVISYSAMSFTLTR